MKLSVTNIVLFRSGSRGVVVGWKDGEPVYIVGSRFTNPIKKWNSKGAYGSSTTQSNFDILAVYDGSSLANPTEAFKASLKLDTLPLVWKEEAE